MPVVEIVVLPLSLLEAFHRTKDPYQDWGYLLRFLSPLPVPELSADQDDVMVDDHPQRMRDLRV
jgi:hypothetical protein